MVDVPKVVGPDFPVPEAGAWSLGRARGMSGKHSSGCVEAIHGLGKIRICGCTAVSCSVSPPCYEKAACSSGFHSPDLLR